MRPFYIIPLVFPALGLANKAEDNFAAVLFGNDYEFSVERGPCVNLKKGQPIFHEIKVTGHDVCTVYANLKCDTKVREFRGGVHEITNVVFKSIKCTVSEEL
ncbi:hypothetical protein H634G_00115 [Metarhizium anisopliae BRIP 53293]|uniref:Uncharacterized protein n=1 Tax=Metarhizium anisopliae BRIP 53293 TaxID=1291518 RepID=A0A0D9PED0_METAN|nr:hypothetical protein H634G_00115 [Metarhizium anisopliae BRIP 53293]KJK88667.1 hypothetical protein H633G_07477 [Metarhizium anisopliae BRIP 53284]